MSEPHVCVASVTVGFVIAPRQCGKTAHYEFNGTWYCKRHHPPTVRAKNAERQAKWEAEWNARMQQQERAVREREEMQRKAAAYDTAVQVGWNWMLDGQPYGPAYYGNPPDADITAIGAESGRTVRLLYAIEEER